MFRCKMCFNSHFPNIKFCQWSNNKAKKIVKTPHCEQTILEQKTIDLILRHIKQLEERLTERNSNGIAGTNNKIIVKDMEENNVNSKNRERLSAWKGYIDLQICLDSHAVVTYIKDYSTKGLSR